MSVNGSTTATVEERLRRLENPAGLPQIPQSPPPPPPDTWAGKQQAEQERRRQERLAAHRADVERQARAEAAQVEVERKRKERNAPKLAKLDAEISVLEAKKRAAVKPFENTLARLRLERRAL